MDINTRNYAHFKTKLHDGCRLRNNGYSHISVQKLEIISISFHFKKGRTSELCCRFHGKVVKCVWAHASMLICDGMQFKSVSGDGTPFFLYCKSVLWKWPVCTWILFLIYMIFVTVLACKMSKILPTAIPFLWLFICIHNCFVSV